MHAAGATGTAADVAGSWVEHLRAGGTTPWRSWRESHPAGPAPVPPVVPGAQQLELLRRCNLAGPVPAPLATRVLEASAPGRGRPDLQLEGAAERLAFGPPPVDPADLPDDELIRVAAGLLAEDVVADGLPDPHHVPGARWFRTRYRVTGDPLLAAAARRDLTRRGRPPGGRGAVVLVLGADLGQLLADVWTDRCLADGAPAWSDWVDRLARRGPLPPRADLAHTAASWAARVGRDRVHVVLDPAAAPRLVGVRRALATPTPLSADATELSRRVGQVLGLLAVPPARADLLEHTLRPRLAAVGGAPLTLPARHQRWARLRAVRVQKALLRAGYPVHGDPDRLLPVLRDGVEQPDDAGVLQLAMRLLLEKRSE
ncbi:hypothetical protein [Nocardioides mangrovi]|uniref:Uncharacterized protein n=1 Tax=Nocardioides mangrovi TaxID=2874580 RepID=A0ABS7UE97_9ACTN|nr:hypothetical protein [Nocardioides mangrovi]MBZ5739324.1 hypothetical protein [Nocardioides mangrovi]